MPARALAARVRVSHSPRSWRTSGGIPYPSSRRKPGPTGQSHGRRKNGSRLSPGRQFERISKQQETPIESAHSLDLLDQIGELAAVFVPDRLHRVLERLLVGDVIDLDIAALHPVEGIGLFLVPQIARIGLRLADNLLQAVQLDRGMRLHR